MLCLIITSFVLDSNKEEFCISLVAVRIHNLPCLCNGTAGTNVWGSAEDVLVHHISLFCCAKHVIKLF